MNAWVLAAVLVAQAAAQHFGAATSLLRPLHPLHAWWVPGFNSTS